MLTLLELRRSVRCLCFPLAKTFLELNFSARVEACWIPMNVCLAHCVVRERFDANPKRESILIIVIFLREIFHVVNTMLTKSLRSLHAMFSLRLLALIITPNCVHV